MRRLLATAGIAGVLLAGGGLLVASKGAESNAAIDAAARASTCNVVNAADEAAVGGGTVEEARDRNLTILITKANSLRVPVKGIVEGIATALVESGGLNLASHAVPESLNYPHDINKAVYFPDGTPSGDLNSIGLIQQRVGFGWFDTIENGMKPAVQAEAFFRALLKVPGWEDMPFGKAAQAVQKSGHPERYAAREVEASALYQRLAGAAGSGASVVNAGFGASCPDSVVNAGADPASTVKGQWANPLKPYPYVIVSHYGPRNLFGATFHKGEDLAGVTGTPVKAACKGQILTANWVFGGGGNQVMIRCTEKGVTVKLMHNSRFYVKVGQNVEAGQLVAAMGSTGNSTGPHSHVQVEVNGQHVPPLPFFLERGVPL